MFTFDQEMLNQLLRAISSGFGESPSKIIVFSTIMTVFLGILLFFYIYQSRKSSANKIHHAQTMYDSIVHTLKLTGPEKDLLDRMTKYLRKPTDKPLLLEHEPTFNAAAQKIYQTERIPDIALAALRLKLGFETQNREQIPHSTALLSAGMSVVIVQKGTGKIWGRVWNQESFSFNVALDPGCDPPQEGKAVRVYFKNLSGLFYFYTVVEKSGHRLIKLRHSEHIKRIQRRTYYRKKIKLPVYVKPLESEEHPFPSRFIDLGGGGASLVNPDGRFKVGDKIYLTFYQSHDTKIDLIGSIVRLSSKGKIAHIEFVTIADSNRDHIMGLLFKDNR